MVEKVIKISVDTKDAVKNIDNLDDSLDDLNKTGGQTQSGLNQMSGQAMSGIKNFKFMGVSINSVSASLKLLKVSLIATGIGAIVVAVGTLASAFLSTQEGVDALNSVLKPLQTVLETIWGIAQNLGRGLFQMVNGDISGGFDTMANAVENVGDQMDEAWKKGQRLHEMQLQIRDAEIEIITAVTDLNISRAKSLAIAEDINSTAEERRKGYKDAIESNNQIAELRQGILQLRIDELKLSQTINDTDSAGYKELVQLQADLKNAEFQRITQETALTKKLNTVKEKAPDKVDTSAQDKINAEAQKETDRLLKLETDRLQAIDDIRLEFKEKRENDEANTRVLALELEEARKIEDLERLNATEEEKLNVKLYYEGLLETAREEAKAKEEADRIKLAKEEEKINAKKNADILRDEELVKNAKIELAYIGLDIISMLAEEGSALAKGAMVAQATMNTYLGITSALSAVSIIPDPFGTILKFANAAAIGVAGFINVKKILSTKPQRGGGGGGSRGAVPSASGGGGGSAPSFNLVEGSSSNQIQDSIDSQNSAPQKSYVVSQDMTSEQQLDRNIKETASL